MILSHYAIDLYKAYSEKKAKKQNEEKEGQVMPPNREENKVEIGKLGRMKG